MSANYAKLILDQHARIVELEADNARLQKSINDCSTEEGLCYSNELQRLSDRIVQLETALREIGLEVSSNGCDGTGDEVCVYTESPIEDWCPMCRVGASIRAALAPKEPS